MPAEPLQRRSLNPQSAFLEAGYVLFREDSAMTVKATEIIGVADA
jgi:hypothetical protein